MKNGRGEYERKQNCFSRIDHFWKNLITQTIHSCYLKKTAPTRYIFTKLKKSSAGIDFKIPYKRTMLHAYLVKTGLQYQKADNMKVIMKNRRLFAWRYKYLIKVQKYRRDGYLVVYLDEN